MIALQPIFHGFGVFSIKPVRVGNGLQNLGVCGFKAGEPGGVFALA